MQVHKVLPTTALLQVELMPAFFTIALEMLN
jgi:hypothetical protein